MHGEKSEETKGSTKEMEARRATMEAIGQAIAAKRSDAIRARVSSAIEDEWTEDEEFYEGIDEFNRGSSKTWSQKPPGRAAVGDVGGSTIFLNITGPYCDAAGASLADMLMPTDDTSWHITNTPVPELVQFVEGKIPKAVSESIRADSAKIQPDDPESFAQETEAKMVDKAQAMLDQAKDKAQKAQTRIEDWLVECQYHAAMRKVIEDAARVGSGVLKGPIPAKSKQIAYVDGELVIKEEIKPVSRYIDYRNLYPAEGCGECIHDGAYIFERDDISSKQLRELIGVPGYDDDQIWEVLAEGPTIAGPTVQGIEDMTKRETKNLYEIWYFYGELDSEDMETVGCECEKGGSIPAHVVMVNNRVIKVVMSHLDTGEFPYDVMVWKKRKGMPWGVGVARQIRTAQMMINAAARNLMDNAGLAGGPMWAYKQGILEPMDGVAELMPRKGWYASEDSDIDAIQNAFTYFKLDMMVNELQTIIYLGLKLAEDVTGLPMIMQGQMGAQKLDTLGQTQILNNNANIVRRRIARLFDDLVTEPHIRRYYNYLLQYGEDDEKGEFVIDARGSSNLVERTIQKEKTLSLMEMSQNPVYGLDPKKVAAEYLRSEKFDVKNFEYDDEEWKKIVENMSQPQQNDPRAEIAKMTLELKNSMQDKELAHKEKMKAAEIQAEERFEQIRQEFAQAIEQFKGNLQKEIAEMEYQGDKDIQFDALKTRLNETTLKLRVTQDLAKVDAAAKLMPKPPVEPPQHAPNGESYQQ